MLNNVYILCNVFSNFLPCRSRTMEKMFLFLVYKNMSVYSLYIVQYAHSFVFFFTCTVYVYVTLSYAELQLSFCTSSCTVQNVHTIDNNTITTVCALYNAHVLYEDLNKYIMYYVTLCNADQVIPLSPKICLV